MTVEVDLNEYLAMKRALGYSQGVLEGIKLNLGGRTLNSEATLLAIKYALVEIAKADRE